MSVPTILVVDDCQSVRLSLKRMLTEAGYVVVTARDGEEALSRLTENPDLVVLDVNMPRLDGFGFCEQLNRDHPTFHDVPIVFLTTENSKALQILGDELGAYLHKPVEEQRLLDTLATQLSQV